MAVAFDATTNVGTQTNNVTSPITAGLTIGASGTLAVAVFTCADGSGAALSTVTSMTWNSVSMTLVANKTASDSKSNIYVYAIVNPTTGNHTCSASFTGGTASAQQTIDLDIFSFKGTDTSSVANAIPAANVITDATNDNSTNYPVSAFSVTTANGDCACAAMNSAGSAYSAVVAGTIINHDALNNVNYASGFHLAVGSTTTEQFQTLAGGGSSPCCGIAFRISQPGGDVLAASPGMRWM